ncbi:MAG: hypothetical protein K0R08_571 [Solimicrobium sp.]|jgi:hypothetical protein|nr:hypothetical protein [Solimicrobium sp.]
MRGGLLINVAPKLAGISEKMRTKNVVTGIVCTAALI